MLRQAPFPKRQKLTPGCARGAPIMPGNLANGRHTAYRLRPHSVKRAQEWQVGGQTGQAVPGGPPLRRAYSQYIAAPPAQDQPPAECRDGHPPPATISCGNRTGVARGLTPPATPVFAFPLTQDFPASTGLPRSRGALPPVQGAQQHARLRGRAEKATANAVRHTPTPERSNP